MRAFIFTLFPIFIYTLNNIPTVKHSSDVYLCNNEYGKKYHFTPNCRGLKACTHPIIKVSLTEAKKRGKTICGYED